MKTFLILMVMASYALGEYQSTKIDMHGGQKSYLYDSKKNNFAKSGMGMSIFLDKNTSKKSEKKKEGK